MAPIITKIDSAGFTELGEGPHWEPKSKSLFYVDIVGRTIHKYTPATDTHTKAAIDGCTGNVSLIIPIKANANKFVISVDRKLGVATWDGKSAFAKFESLAEIDTTDDAKENRINDGKCDASGRIWFGSICLTSVDDNSSKSASFYSLTDGSVAHHFGEVSISNGLTWNESNTKFYYIDSLRKCIEEFDFQLDIGIISNRKVLFDLPQNGIEGFPDGMTIDTDDNLWVAVFNGSCILQVATKETNRLLQKIDMPAQQITSVCFGGENLDELYVTTAKIDATLLPPNHGALYKITNLGCKGFPANEAVL